MTPLDDFATPKPRRARKASVSDARENGDPEPVDPRALAILRGENYIPPPTIKEFLLSTAFVRGIRGPVAGGKSSGACQEIMRRAREQAPQSDGIRRTRWAVVRNTYGELKDTTIKTWLDWFPEELFGKFNRAQGEMRHLIKIEDIELEVLFRALDKPDDVRKVLSLELTGAWFDEARECPRAVIEAMTDRVGRYPAKKDGGCTWRGIIMDTNSPDEDHWWYELAEVVKPAGWAFFAQPPAMVKVDGKWVQNPDAENVNNLNEADYYATRAPGKREDYIKVYYGNQYGFVQEGKPVFPEYADHVHGAKSGLPFTPNRPVYIGIGFGMEYGAIFGQKMETGQWRWIDEFMPPVFGAVTFADQLAAKMRDDFPAGTTFKIFGKHPKDPMDDDADTMTILRRRGINIAPTRQSDAILRRESVATVLNRMIRGEPGLWASTKCKVARKALAGGYCYPRMQVSGEERYHDEPAKNRYRVMGEAAQYMLVGGGEDSAVFKSGGKPVKLKYPEMGVV